MKQNMSPQISGRARERTPHRGSDWTPDPAAPITAIDLVEIARLILLLPLSWTLPVRFWPIVTQGLAFLDSVLRKNIVDARVARIGQVLGDARAATGPTRIVRRSLAANYEDRMQILRSYRPDRWCPEIEIIGLEHVENGLDEGRGIVLWISNFAFSSHITKMALWRAGIAVSHLSRPTHGFSCSLFGIRALNPIQTRIEDRYLRERLIVMPQNARAVWRLLQEKLAENGIVSITVGSQARRIARPRFLAGRIRLATGPAYLAYTTGAALLPIFTLQTNAQSYTVHIGPPLGNGLNADDDLCVDGIVEEFAARLQPIVLRHPGLWRNWSNVDIE
jgi:lauroyl/myristoyl acyltransferase